MPCWASLQVLGIEQYNVAHGMGSSHGISRIIRLAYHEEPAYVPLLKRAYQLWRELEHDTERVHFPLCYYSRPAALYMQGHTLKHAWNIVAL